MLCIPLGHAGTLGSAQWLIRPLRVYSPDENSTTVIPLFSLALSSISVRNVLRELFYI